MAPPSSLSLEVRAAYRSLMRWSARMPQYNFRDWALRRTRAAFREHENASPSEVGVLLDQAEKQLAVLQRQVALGRLYPPEHLVVEDHISSRAVRHQ